MKLSIIIVNWNTKDLLAKCLSSVYADSLDEPFEIIVVDNASTDGSALIVKENFTDVKLIENWDNVGFARANNQAIKQCSGEYVLLLNPDTEVRPGALQAMVNFLDKQDTTGAVGARLLNSDGSLQISCYPKPTLFREFWRMFHLDALVNYADYPMHEWDIQMPREVDVMMGACFMCSQEVLIQVGLMDEDYFMYSEEVDLCFRIQDAGWRLFWLPSAVVVHHGGQSSKQVPLEMFLQLYRSKITFFRKHYGRISGWIYKFILMAAVLARLMVSPLVWIEPGPRSKRHLDLTRNYRKLFMALPGM